jgi:hypothetical protein
LSLSIIWFASELIAALHLADVLTILDCVSVRFVGCTDAA